MAKGTPATAALTKAGVAFTLQVVCQRTSPPAHAAIMMSRGVAAMPYKIRKNY